MTPSDKKQSTPRDLAWLARLDAHLAKLDETGTVTDVNRPWPEFAGEPASRMPPVIPGAAYVNDLMKQVHETGNFLALDMAAGIQKVLDGASDGFTIAYPLSEERNSRWLNLQVSPGPSGALLFHTDITRSRRNETELDQLLAVLEQADEEVLITDPKGIIKYVNQRFEVNTEYPRESVIGQSPSILRSGHHEPEFYEAIWDTLLDKKTWKGTIHNRSRSGREILHDATITPVTDKQGQITAFVSVRRDITRQSRDEKLVRQAHKMEAIGTFAGGIAHDFNNILAGIIGYSELIKEDLEDLDGMDDKTLERLDNVIAASIRARDLISQILAFSRSGREDRHPISITVLAKEVSQFLRASLPATIEIVKSLESNSLVMADPTHIHQILMNLCANARDAMAADGGTLSIFLKDVHLADEEDGLAAGEYIRLTVADTGSGIDPEIIDHIMEPFFTTKPKGKGTGMGLSVVHGIVRGLGGTIRVFSRKNKGARFDVLLPVHGRDRRIAEPVTQAPEPIRGGTETLLFVDDEDALTQIATDSLTGLGYQVAAFTDSRGALDYFTARSDACDMVISDITMPVMPGDALVAEMRKIRPDLPVILITGASERMDEPRARSLGIDALLYKPITIETMAKTIRRVLDGEDAWQIS